MQEQFLTKMGVSDEGVKVWRQARKETAEVRAQIRTRADAIFAKVMGAFRSSRVSEAELAGSTGYGYSDEARGAVDRLWAETFGCESAAVRLQWVSGTHAIASALRGNLRPGQTLLAATGRPYDTLAPLIGSPVPYSGSLIEWGVHYKELALSESGIDLQALGEALDETTGLVFLQRSRGYTQRSSLSVAELGKAIEVIRKKVGHRVIILVDNCYGEMVELLEPTQVGADLVAGSLIKNLGATIVPTGAYVAGSAQAVEASLAAMTAPGLGGHVGPTLGFARGMAQALSLAPQTVAQCLEGLVAAAWIFEAAGFSTSPRWNDERTDTIQAITLQSIDAQRAFCKAVQGVGLVDAMATPVPVVQPGYQDPILMAGGTFISGSSAELSADGPERPPYSCYLQGGTARMHVELGALAAFDALGAQSSLVGAHGMRLS